MINGTERILVCCGTSCIANGALSLAEALEAELASRGWDDIAVQLVRTGCSGECEQGPIVRLMPRDVVYYRAAARDAAAIVASPRPAAAHWLRNAAAPLPRGADWWEGGRRCAARHVGVESRPPRARAGGAGRGAPRGR